MEIPELNDISNKVKGWQTEETRYFKAILELVDLLATELAISQLMTCALAEFVLATQETSYPN